MSQKKSKKGIAPSTIATLVQLGSGVVSALVIVLTVINKD
jgi:hypothetical protein